MLYRFQYVTPEGSPPSAWSKAYSFNSAESFKEWLEGRFPGGQKFTVEECTPMERAQWLIATHNERGMGIIPSNSQTALDHIKLLCGPTSAEALAYTEHLQSL